MGKFSEEDIALAQKVQSTYGVPSSVTLGQYALESGYGKHTIGTNNYFNIKGNGTKGYANYDSKESAFMAYGELLSKDRYTSQTKGAQTVEEYVQGVKNGGYATDPNYVQKVMAVINSNNLTDYDTGGGFVPSGSSESNNVKWWGDIVIVIFAVLLLVMGVIFIGMSVTDNKIVNSVKKAVT